MIQKSINIKNLKVVIISITVFIVVISTAFYSFNSYKINLQNSEETKKGMLLSIAKTLSLQINGDEHQKIVGLYTKKDAIKLNEDDSIYNKLHLVLKNAGIANNVNTDIYTLVIDTVNTEKSFFGVSSSNPYFRHSYNPPEETKHRYGESYALSAYGDAHGKWISAIAPIKNSDNRTVAIVQVDLKFDKFILDAQKEATKGLLEFLGVVIIIMLIILALPIYTLNKIDAQQKFVLSEFTQLEELSKHIEKFLNNILIGNTDDIDDIDDSFSDKDNEIYKQLVETQRKVSETTKKEHEQQWILQGTGGITELLQINDNIEVLGSKIIKYIVNYTDFVQGAFYLYNDDVIKMISRFAYNRKKYTYNEFKIGEGLVGQCAYEKDTIYRTEIPEEFVSITSGLIFDKKPTSILLVPLLNGGDLLGVLEFASLQKISKTKIEFIEEVSSIAAQTIFNIQTNNQTSKFLEDALEMGGELKEQKVILEQNAEEMKATQEELERTNSKLEEQFQEVENQQKRLQSLLSKSSEIITIYDEFFSVKYKSPSVEHILGYKPNDFVKNGLIEVDKDYLNIIEDTFKTLLKNPDGHKTIEYLCYKKDGTKVWLEADCRNLLKDRSINGFIVNSRDITGRREAEKEQEMRAKMQALSENSQDIIMRIDLEGNFQYVNSRLRHYTGIFTKFIGKNYNDVGINTDIVRRWGKVLKDIQKEPKLIQREMFFETDVDEFIMQVNAIPEFNKNEELDSVLLVLHDITNRKKQEIEVQDSNKKITESINYAKRIQNAIIPIEEELKSQFKDFMMFYMPKDVVSGDFPWYYKKDDYIYIAAVDCTGHGVPGAMMSLIGYLLLNDIVNGEENLTPSEVLLQLHKGVIQTLKQDVKGNNTSDGMDVSLLRISLKSNEVHYAGAHRPLYLLRDGEIEQFKGSPFPIGGMQYRGRNKYKNREFDYKEGDKLFFFSDGLPDQFGANGEDKYSPQRIRELITMNQDKSMNELENIFKSDLISWMGEEKQIDDVLLMGISL